MKHLRLVLALAALAFTPSLAKADPITYTFNQTVTQDATDYATVTGTVTTDGTLGNITPANITNFDLFVNETAGGQTESAEFSIALAHAANIQVGVSGNGYFTAAADTLSFDSSQNSGIIFGGYGTGFVQFSTGSEEAYVKVPPYLAVTAPESGVQVIASVASAQTPEPSSLLLLGTGALGVAGAMRRRMVRA